MNNLTPERKHITLWFNVALSLYYLADEFSYQMIKPIDDKKSYLDLIFPDGKIGLLAVSILVMLAVGTFLVREFWCRFVSDIFNLRTITTQEAYALLLISMYFFNAP